MPIVVRTGNLSRLIWPTATAYAVNPQGDLAIINADGHEVGRVGRGQWATVSSTDHEPDRASEPLR
jgi:hypothetical protein